MQFSNRFKTLVLITGLVAVGANRPQPKEEEYKNMQVLPKNISQKALQQIMVDDFQDGLGVACNFCHAEEKGSHHLDYASDAKPEKEIARHMMRMTLTINRDYFQLKNAMIGDSFLSVNCATCHRGQPHPEKE